MPNKSNIIQFMGIGPNPRRMIEATANKVTKGAITPDELRQGPPDPRSCKNVGSQKETMFREKTRCFGKTRCFHILPNCNNAVKF